jgi:putative inorganic carbon (hco3(-)) transporter
MSRSLSSTVSAWLLLVPLAGAVMVNARPVSMAWSISVAVMALLSLLFWWRGSRHRDRDFERHITALALLGPAYVAFQLVPLPLTLLRMISPRRAELVEALGSVMTVPRLAPLSVDPAATWTALGTVLACVLCFLMVREVTWRSLRVASWVMAIPIIALAAFEAAVALEQALIGQEVVGTYWNRNHLSGFLEMVLPLAVAFAWNSSRKNAGGRLVSARRMLRSLALDTLLPVAAIAVMVFAVVASGSRLGFISMLAGLVAMPMVFAAMRLRGGLRIGAVAVIPMLAVTLFVALANRDVLATLSTYLDSTGDMTGENRLPIWADSLQLHHAYPVFGTGLGTYSTAFVAFQTSGLANHWTHAHNDYIEFATDLGALGFAIFGALLIAVLWRAFKLVEVSRRSGSDLVALGCIGGIAAIAVHSIGDFNLALPANIFLLAWIAGIAAGIPPRLGLETQAERRADPQARDLQAEAERAAVARGTRRAAIALSLATLALSSAAIAKSARDDSAQAVSVDAKLDAVRRSPASPFLWLDLAEALKTAGRIDQAKASVARAVALGPHHSVMIRRAATIADDLGDRPRAVSLISREFQQKGIDPAELFDWFVERGIPNADVLAGLRSDGRALSAFVKYLLLPGTCPDAQKAWHELLARHRPDPRLAADYANFVENDCGLPEEAERAWLEYAQKVQPGYRESEWVFNGGFELDRTPVRFDWQWRPDAREAEAAPDATEKSSGKRSLRMSFRGSSSAAYEGAFQQVAVSPGTYRFSAAVRTQDLSSADGILFRIRGDGPKRVDLESAQTTATTAWHNVAMDVVVPDGVSTISIQIVRRPGPQSAQEGGLTGIAWVDDVTLRKIG